MSDWGGLPVSQDGQEPPTQCAHCKATDPPKARAIASPSSLAVPALSLATAACGGGGSSSASTTTAQPGFGTSAASSVRKPQSDAQAVRFLLHASLSASKSEVSALRRDGYEAWLDEMLSLPNDQSAQEFYASRGFDAVDGKRYFQRSKTADHMIWKQLMFGGNAVRKRVAFALSEFFVVSVENLKMYWPALAIGAFWDLLNKHAFGNFRNLLEAVTLNPAMAVYLDTIGNRKSDPESGQAPDENYAREVMQLFSIGLYHLNIDGSVKEVGGKASETFTNEDVKGLAKCFTGYDFDVTGVTPSTFPGYPDLPLIGPEYVHNPITADPTRWSNSDGVSYHSEDEKAFLGVSIAPGTGPEETLKFALDTLFNHPNVGPFFGKQMIQRLVTSNPSPGYIQRVAEVFNDNGKGERGDLRALFKAILLDQEALSEDSLADFEFGKLREPALRLAQWGRTFGANSETGDWLIDAVERQHDQIGQAPLRAPHVFNFFRPGFVPGRSTAQQRNLVAPEFELVNETSVAGYVNFMQTMIEGRGYSARDVRAKYANELGIVHDPQALLDHLDLYLTGNQLSAPARNAILDALRSIEVSSGSDETTKLRRVHLGALLAMACTDYLVQR
ncbi:DUF1800 domain-containing protein [Altererythrobacter sp.]|uniref:DUF1800 domain-containing protein n=1 Tax=Altererythrobacter sp. TaxID=1872480 RepID=UPI003D09D0E9